MKTLQSIAVVMTLALSVSALAQRMSESVQVTIVEVPVTVAGSDGKAVRGLTKDAFEVLDNGKRVPIEYFEVLDLKLIPTAPGKPLPAAATRNFLLFFDIANSTPGTIRRAAEAADAFIERQLGERDLAAVATFTAESGAKLITSFTSDKSVLKAAVQTLGDPRYFKAGDPLMISFDATRLTPDRVFDGGHAGWAGDFDVPAPGGKNMTTSTGETVAEIVDELLDPTGSNNHERVLREAELRNRLRIQLTNMSTIARALDRLHGRKEIILLSEGFDARLVQGNEDLSFKGTQKETDTAFSGEIWNVDQEQRFGNTAALRDIGEMAEIFRRSDVVLHAIDIKGLRSEVGNVTTGDVPTLASKSNQSLFLLTKPTGGTVFQNTNDLEANFARMLAQQEVVYLLGFRAKSTKKKDKFHSLKVTSKVPGARVSHRAGYFEPSALATNLEKTISLTEILMTDKPVNDLGMSVAITALPGAFVEKARVPVVVEFPGGMLLEGVQDILTANLFIYAFDEKKQVKDHLAQRIALDIVDDVEAVRSGGIRYFGTLQLPPGEYAIKAVARVEESGRVGFVRTDVRVPDFEGATVLPPLFLDQPGNWVMLAGPPRGDAYAYPFAVGGESYIPRSRPALASGTPHRLALFLHRVPLENLGITPLLASASGETKSANVKLVGRTAADAQGSVKLLFDFTPEGLKPGDYELRFTIKPNEGTESVVALPFKVL